MIRLGMTLGIKEEKIEIKEEVEIEIDKTNDADSTDA